MYYPYIFHPSLFFTIAIPYQKKLQYVKNPASAMVPYQAAANAAGLNK